MEILVWYQASASMWMRYSLFWAVTQRRLVVTYRRFGTSVLSSRVSSPRGIILWPLEMGRIACLEESVTHYQSTLFNSPEERLSQEIPQSLWNFLDEAIGKLIDVTFPFSICLMHCRGGSINARYMAGKTSWHTVGRWRVRRAFCKNVFVSSYVKGVQNNDKLPNSQYVKLSIPNLISRSHFKVVFLNVLPRKKRKTVALCNKTNQMH